MFFPTLHPLRLFLGAILFFTAAASSFAQFRVDLEFKRPIYIRYEPIIATITVNNLSGREAELSDDSFHRWLSFEIETADGRIISPKESDYRLQPMIIGPGETIARSINLTPLYPMGEFGSYRVRASIFVRENNRYYSSPLRTIDITEGRLMWQQVVGVPDNEPGAGGTRRVSVLAHRLPKSTQLYLRIEDPDRGLIFCTHQLGKYITFGKPQVELDVNNQIHVLQNAAPKTFIYSHISLRGEILDRQVFTETATRPLLARQTDGSVKVIGGDVQMPGDPTQTGSGFSIPKAGDRPVPLPKAGEAPKVPDPTPTPGKKPKKETPKPTPTR